MNQVGQTKTFSVQGTPSAGTLAYVFRWWDTEVTASGSGTATKQLNIGGNPSDAFQLRFKCEICDQLGNSQVLNGAVACNNPPNVVPSPTITPNYQALPYQTQVITRAYDLEEAGAIGFFWYSGTNPIASGVTATDGAMPGTYAGTLVGNKTVYKNTFDFAVTQNAVLTCKVVDFDSGTTALDYRIGGFDPGVPQFSVAAQPDSLTADAATLPSQFIGNQPVTFSVYAADAQSGSIAFYWSFYGTNGWTASDVPFFSTGTTALLGTGFRNDVARNISGETVTGLRTVLVTVTNTRTGKSAWSSVDINLIKNDAPAVSAVNVYSVTTGQPLVIAGISKAANPIVKFSGTASDPNNDVVYYQWGLSQPIAPASVTLYGRDIFVDISGFPTGNVALGTVKVVDRLGLESVPFTVPQITLVT